MWIIWEVRALSFPRCWVFSSSLNCAAPTVQHSFVSLSASRCLWPCCLKSFLSAPCGDLAASSLESPSSGLWAQGRWKASHSCFLHHRPLSSLPLGVCAPDNLPSLFWHPSLCPWKLPNLCSLSTPPHPGRQSVVEVVVLSLALLWSFESGDISGSSYTPKIKFLHPKDKQEWPNLSCPNPCWRVLCQPLTQQRQERLGGCRHSCSR